MWQVSVRRTVGEDRLDQQTSSKHYCNYYYHCKHTHIHAAKLSSFIHLSVVCRLILLLSLFVGSPKDINCLIFVFTVVIVS